MVYPTSHLFPARSWTQFKSTKPCSTIPIASADAKNEEHYFVSTDGRLMSVTAVNAAFAQDFVYWTRPFPDVVMQQLLDGSLCFGVFKYKIPVAQRVDRSEIDVSEIAPEEVEQIGLARLVTDTVTTAWLTDVYILPEYQSRGLGSWMMDCLKDTLLAPSDEGMSYLRRIMLVTTHRDGDGGRREDYYSKTFDMQVVGHEVRNGLVLSVMSAVIKPKVDQIA
jgi:GNAT superfamily N-acetyltransferase